MRGRIVGALAVGLLLTRSSAAAILGPQTLAVVPVAFADAPYQSLTPAAVQAWAFGAGAPAVCLAEGTSLDQCLRFLSYSRASFVGQTYPYVILPASYAENGCPPGPIAQAVLAQVGISGPAYRYAVIRIPDDARCSGETTYTTFPLNGLTVIMMAKPAGGMWAIGRAFNGSYGYTQNCIAGACSLNRPSYDPWAMVSGGGGAGWGNLHATDKIPLGWLTQSASELRAVTTSGTYTIGPYETPLGSAPKSLQIGFSFLEWHYLPCAPDVFKCITDPPALVVHDAIALNDVDTVGAAQRFVLPVGNTYKVFNGPSITLVSQGVDTATVRIDLAGGTPTSTYPVDPCYPKACPAPDPTPTPTPAPAGTDDNCLIKVCTSDPLDCGKLCGAPAPSSCTKNCTDSTPPPVSGSPGWSLTGGDFAAIIRGNEYRELGVKPANEFNINGIASLMNNVDAPGVNAFNLVAMNVEHIISGCGDDRNYFTGWNGAYTSHQLDAQTVQITRLAADDPWRMAYTLTYHLVAPHAIDLTATFTPMDAAQFCDRNYAVVMFPNYMAPVLDPSFSFLGISASGQPETWQRGDTPDTIAFWNQGGTYIAQNADALAFKDNNNANALTSYDYPRYTRPFYYGLSRNGMVFELMFNKSVTPTDEIRLTAFKYLVKADPANPKPAWDWQFVMHPIVGGQSYTFKARLIWKRFVSPADVLADYLAFVASLP